MEQARGSLENIVDASNMWKSKLSEHSASGAAIVFPRSPKAAKAAQRVVPPSDVGAECAGLVLHAFAFETAKKAFWRRLVRARRCRVTIPGSLDVLEARFGVDVALECERLGLFDVECPVPEPTTSCSEHALHYVAWRTAYQQWLAWQRVSEDDLATFFEAECRTMTIVGMLVRLVMTAQHLPGGPAKLGRALRAMVFDGPSGDLRLEAAAILLLGTRIGLHPDYHRTIELLTRALGRRLLRDYRLPVLHICAVWADAMNEDCASKATESTDHRHCFDWWHKPLSDVVRARYGDRSLGQVWVGDPEYLRRQTQNFPCLRTFCDCAGRVDPGRDLAVRWLLRSFADKGGEELLLWRLRRHYKQKKRDQKPSTEKKLMRRRERRAKWAAGQQEVRARNKLAMRLKKRLEAVKKAQKVESIRKKREHLMSAAHGLSTQPVSKRKKRDCRGDGGLFSLDAL